MNIVIKKVPGSYLVDTNKLRITNIDGQSSVLFEDISSMTWKSRESLPNGAMLTGIFAICMGLPGLMLDNSSFFTLLLVSGIGCIIFALSTKEKWEDVIVETRGGSNLSYSVEVGMGAIEVDKIENERSRNKSTF